MAELLSIDNFIGMVADAPDGKQPQGTCKEIKNLVYDRERGSLVTRFTYENSIARPTGVSTLNSWLTFPTTYPSVQDNHIWFTEDGIFHRPYFHNSSTPTDDWKLISESKAFDTVALGDITINASPTNTLVLVNADADGFSTTANYYKNWVLYNDQNSEQFFVTAYSYSAASSGTATFTLSSIVGLAAGEVPDLTAFRYFHKDPSFTPAFTFPAGYADESGYRWSGGAGSTVGLKNLKHKYISKNFFANSGTAYQFNGSYIDQAECSAPAASLLVSLAAADANANAIASAQNYDFSNGATTNWAGNGNTSVYVGQSALTIGGDLTNGLVILTDGGDGDNTTNYANLTTTYTNNVTNNIEQTVKIKGSAFLQYALQPASIGVRVIVNGVNYDSPTLFFRQPTTGAGGFPATIVNDTLTFIFTPNSTNKPEIRIFLPNVSKGHASSVKIDAISITPTSSATVELESNKTYKLWGTYVYDRTQESEPTYLGSSYLTGKLSKLSYQIQQKLTVNKFVTGIKLYLSQENGDERLSTTTTVTSRYLIADIPIDDDSTSTWTFDTTDGRYEYSGSIAFAEWNNRGLTWEEETGRNQSDSITCSYFLATQASGRIFLADDYDYSDGRLYINRVRYTGFSRYGATPDIFPNIQQKFITTITAGRSQEIRNIVEFYGDVIVLKKSSILRLKTSNPNPLTWQLALIKNGVGTRSSKGSLKFDKGLLFTDLYSAYLYDGYTVTDILKGRWKNKYQTHITTDAYAITTKVFSNPVNDTICIGLGSSVSPELVYEFNADTWLPVLIQQSSATYDLNNLVQTSDGRIHFAPTSVGANAFKIATSHGSVLVDVSLNTGYYGMPKGKLGIAKWVYVLAECPVGSPFTVTIYKDKASSEFASATFTPTAITPTLYKFQTSSDITAKMLKVEISQTGTVAPSAQPMVIHKLWVEGDIVDEYTDVTILGA